MTKTKPRVLLLAEAANPEWVSVPLVGWSLASALREVADVHLVTQVRNRDAILRAGLREGEDFTAIDTEYAAAPLNRVGEILRGGSNRGWTVFAALMSLAYPFFERDAWKLFGPDLRAGRFDLVHRITPVSVSSASSMAPKLAGIGVPFVLGPLNGGVPWPNGYEAARQAEGEGLSRLRALGSVFPGRRKMLRTSSVIMAGAEIMARELRAQVPARRRGRVVWLPENAIDPDRFPDVERPARERDAPLRASFVGRLVPLKMVDVLLEAAVPLLSSGRLVLDIVGDGPVMGRLQDLVREHALDGAVTLHGNVPHKEVASILARSDLFVFPSIREFGGGVILEAMAMGAVPIVVDYAGPGELVDDAVGFKLPLGGGPDDLRAALAAKLKAVVEDPSALSDRAAAGRERVRRQFTWPAKAKQIAEIYAQVLADPKGDGPIEGPFHRS